MENNHYDERLDKFMKYFVPILTSGATGYLLAKGDIKSTIVLGFVTAILFYENLKEDLSNRSSLKGLEQKVLIDK